MANVQIPVVSSYEIMKRYRRIRPIVKVNGRMYFLRSFSEKEVYSKSFIHDLDKEIREPVRGYPVKVEDFFCLHEFAFEDGFRPSIYEVLAQIDSGLLNKVGAFEIIESPETVGDIEKDRLSTVAFKHGYRVSKVRLYRR